MEVGPEKKMRGEYDHYTLYEYVKLQRLSKEKPFGRVWVFIMLIKQNGNFLNVGKWGHMI